jgi:hypothetical protein
MNLAPHEYMFLGACVGWIAAALCFWLIPTWRVRDIITMDNEQLRKLAQQVKHEWLYRFPEQRKAYDAAERARDDYDTDGSGFFD